MNKYNSRGSQLSNNDQCSPKGVPALSPRLNNIGLRNEIDQSSLRHGYLLDYEKLFEGRNITRIGLILDKRHIAISNTFAEFFPEAIIEVFSYSQIRFREKLRSNINIVEVESAKTVHAAVSGLPQFDLIVEDSNNKKSQKRELLRVTLAAVRDGGLYISEDLHASYVPSLIDDSGEDILQYACRLIAIKSSRGRYPELSTQDDIALSKLIRKLSFDGKLLVIEKCGKTVIKLRHQGLEKVLQQTYGETWGRVLDTYEGSSISSKSVVSTNRDSLASAKFKNPIQVPNVLVREYYDVVAVPRQLLLKESILLPDSFRLHLMPRLNNSALNRLSHHYAMDPRSSDDLVHLSGQYYYLDLEYTRHFGHFMTEAISRLYAWDRAKENNPNLRILMSSQASNGRPPKYQMDILNAYGIVDEDIHTFRGPVRIESLISATPLFHNVFYAHPMLAETYARLSDSLVNLDAPKSEKIFVSRRSGMWRECLNMNDLENLFIARGFDVIYPEELSVSEQATVFAGASIIAGYIGSALYSVMFCRKSIDIIAFVNTSYKATNEYLISSVIGHRMHMFWCDDIVGNRDVDNKGRPLGPTNFDYKFDFERDGDALLNILIDLGT